MMDSLELLNAAMRARLRAYAPYSNFQVGAALATKDARVFYGCNIENAAYSLCQCAERTAFCAAFAEGYSIGDFDKLAVVADTSDLISPCGACRQVIHELGGHNPKLVLGNLHGEFKETTAGALLPLAFNPQHLR